MSIEIIPLERLAIMIIPVFVVVLLMRFWGSSYGKALYALSRMLLQLLLIGYALIMIFESDSSVMTLGVLFLMLMASAWISLNTLTLDSEKGQHRYPKARLFFCAGLAVLVGGGSLLCLVTQVVLNLEPWYLPRYTIPLAGMIFSTAMTSISLAGERLQAELSKKIPYAEAQKIAFNTAMIPNINALFAVGLVSLPGMMTGQILSGVSPFIAARYQIMVMLMLFATSGMAALIFLISGRSVLDSHTRPED